MLNWDFDKVKSPNYTRKHAVSHTLADMTEAESVTFTLILCPCCYFSSSIHLCRFDEIFFCSPFLCSHSPFKFFTVDLTCLSWKYRNEIRFLWFTIQSHLFYQLLVTYKIIKQTCKSTHTCIHVKSHFSSNIQ